MKFTMCRGQNATNFDGIDSLLNPNLLREAGVFVHDMPSHFGGKQCIEKNNVSIPLFYLPSKGKLCLNPVEDAVTSPTMEIIADHGELSPLVEEPLAFRRIAVKEMQRLPGGPSTESTKKTLENTTSFYGNSGDRVKGVIHPKDHMKKRLTRLSARRIKGTMCTDTVFCSGETSVDGFNCFQIFYSKLSKFIYAVPLKGKCFNHEALEELISQVGVPDKLHFDNAKSQVGKSWKKIFRRWGMKRHTIEPHHQNQNAAEQMVQVLKQRASYLLELHNAPKKY